MKARERLNIRIKGKNLETQQHKNQNKEDDFPSVLKKAMGERRGLQGISWQLLIAFQLSTTSNKSAMPTSGTVEIFPTKSKDITLLMQHFYRFLPKEKTN
jgi:hypothetical protein